MSTARDPSAHPEAPVPATPATPAGEPSLRLMAEAEHKGESFPVILIRGLQLQRGIAASVFALGLILVAAYLLRMLPNYVAHSVVTILPGAAHRADSAAAQRSPGEESADEAYIQQQIHIASGRDVLLGALRKIPTLSWRRLGESDATAADRLERALTVKRIGATSQISISVHAPNAMLAAQLSNAVADSFVEHSRLAPPPADPHRMDLLREERDRVQKELSADREEQEDLVKMPGASSSVGKSVFLPYSAQISELRSELFNARTASDGAAARLMNMGSVDARSTAALDAETDELIAADPGLVSMKTSLSERRAALTARLASLTPDKPLFKQDSDELSQINASLDSMMNDMHAKAAAELRQKLQNDLEGTASLEARLNIQLAKLTMMTGNAGPRADRAADLATDIVRLQKRFAAADEQLHSLSLENKPLEGMSYLSSAALPPTQSSDGDVLLNALLLALVSLILAVATAFAAHKFDPHVYVAADVEHVLKCSLLAQVPEFGDVPAGVAEEYVLRLALAIEKAYEQKELKSCIFTGIAPGAGVTTLAGQVTSMLQAMGRTTILIDGVSASSTTAPESEVPASADIARTTPVAILERVAHEADKDSIVLTDTAPLLTSGETEYLTQFVDAAIVVIESGVTTRAQLREVVQTLQRLQIAASGFVLNKIALSRANPSFRQSLRAVEKHLASQGQSPTRNIASTRPSNRSNYPVRSESTSASERGPEINALDSAATASFETIPFEAAQSIPIPTPVTASRPIVEPQTASVSPAPQSQTGSRPMRGRGEPTRTAPGPASQSETGTRLRTGDIPNPEVRADTGSIPAAAQESTLVENILSQAPISTDLSLPMADHIKEMEDDDLPYSATARLGGLRKLVVSLGLQNFHREAAARNESDSDARIERDAGAPIDSGTYAAANDDPPETDPFATRVIALPEFLLPARQPSESETPKEPLRAVPAPARRDPAEEIETLPSWRGQYRKRRYPPV